MNHPLSRASRDVLELAVTGRPYPAIDYALGLLADGMAPDHLILDVLADVQREVGRLWQSNQWSVAQEHAATAVIDGVVGAVGLQPRIPPVAKRGHALVACVEEEYHSLPARMGVERLRYVGWDVTFLGANVPAHDLQKFAVDVDPDLIVLSCTLSVHLAGAARCISALADLGRGVVVAGAAFGDSPRRAARLGASAWIGPGVDLSVLSGPLGPARSTTLTTPESVHLQLHGLDLVEAAMAQMLDVMQPMALCTSRELASTRRDLADILRCLALAMDFDEPHLFVEFIVWWQEMLMARRVPSADVISALEIVGDVVSRSGLDQSAALCQSARSHLVTSRHGAFTLR